MLRLTNSHYRRALGRAVLCLSFMFAPLALAAQSVAEGVVFVDANANGLYDKQEVGLAGIPVSNGDTIVVTNADGRYRLPVKLGESVFPILPSNYAFSGSRLIGKGFSYLDYAAAKPTARKRQRKAVTATINFALKPKPVATAFQLNAIGDIQVSDHQELDYLSRTLWPELMVGDSSEVNLFLGDLVNNNLTLYPALAEMMAWLPQTSLTLPGNHDRDVDSIITRQNRTYNRWFGADAYAFNEGQVHFIILNNVSGKGARGYEGRISDRQLRFVANDLRLVPTDRLVVVCMHIPLAFTANRAQLIALLGNYPHRLALSGHLHQVARFFPKADNIMVPELGAGAACGFWWVGEKDWDGIPSALQQGGTPRNYFQLHFDGNRYDFRCKTIGGDAAREMTIYVTGIDTLDRHLRDMVHVAPATLLVTVYGGCDSTVVRCRIDGGPWLTCEKSKAIEPNVARTREMDLIGAYPTRYNRRNPLRKRPSRQLWQLALPPSARSGVHEVEVTAADAYGLRATGQRMYCFPDTAAALPEGK
jgi:hypothetical protein